MSETEKFPDGTLPVHEAISVLEYTTIYKTDKWWKVVALVNSFGHDQIVTYLWLKDTKSGKWKRKQKASAKNEDEWEKVDAAHRKYLPKIKRMRS